MDLKEPLPDPRERAQSQPNIHAQPLKNRRPLTKKNVKIEPVTNEEQRGPFTLPSIILEGEVLDKDPDVPEIHRVVLEGNLERLKELIESGESVNTPDSDGWPPLHTAIRHQHYDCAQLLIKNGATDFFERQKEEYQTRHNLSAKITRGRLFSF